MTPGAARDTRAAVLDEQAEVGPDHVTPEATAAPTFIEPPARWRALDVREVWRYRELVYFLLWRDLKVRYKQTVIGGAWAVLQPLLTMVVFSIVFGRLINVPSEGVPYPIFSYTALLPWTFFAGAVARAGNSLIQDPNLLSKVYFPRVALPLAALSSILVDLAVAFAILVGMMLFYGLVPGFTLLALPLFLLLALLTTIGVGLWLSALNVKYRDINYVIPLLVQFWLFLTPVAYPSTLVPDAWRPLYSLNPMVGVVEGFRWAILGTESLSVGTAFISAAVALVLSVSGLLYFRRVEHEFADVV
jgi:lipopolysaccharide transport system permease protein